MRQRDLSLSHGLTGDVLRAQGTCPAHGLSPESCYFDNMAKRDAGNAERQSDVSLSHGVIGDVLVSQGDLSAALTAYRQSHAIFESLAKRDPGNAQWQIDVAVSCSKLGVHTGVTAAPGASGRYTASRL